MGTRQALSLVGKMGLSAAGKMSAIGAGASLAIDALTIAQISKILYDVVAEESGGLRAPQKCYLVAMNHLEHMERHSRCA